MHGIGYDRIASEYYMAQHVTSRNFDETTAASQKLIRGYLPSQGSYLELGAGRGRLQELLGVPASRTVQTDISAKMLNLSRTRIDSERLNRIRCDALDLPFAPCSFKAVVALLYDPYNKSRLYKEVQRVLDKNGVFVGTLPNITWGRTLRRIRRYRSDLVRFVSLSGEFVTMSSILMSEMRLKKVVTDAGLQVVVVKSLCLPAKVEKISPDIVAPAEKLGLTPTELPILDLVVARKK